MRVLMLVSNDVIHDSRVLKEASALRDAGHQVTAIGWDRAGTAPRSESFAGISIHRIRTEGAMRALRKDLFRNPIWWRRAYRLARGLAFDVVHCHDLDTLPTGVRLRRSSGKPLVYDCHEVFGYMIEHDVPRFVASYAFRMERRLSLEADRVVAVNPFVKEYIDRVSGKSAVLVMNCPEITSDGYRAPADSPFTLLYLGTLHRSRFVLEAIDTVAELPSIRLVIGGSKQLTSTVREMCAHQPNTQFIGVVPNERVIPMTIESSAVLAMFDPTHRINQVGLPNKIFEAMAAGRPSIVTEGLPMADFVQKERCGLPVPYTRAGLRSAIDRLRGDPSLAERLGRNAFEAANRTYNWRTESRKLVAMYGELEP